MQFSCNSFALGIAKPSTASLYGSMTPMQKVAEIMQERGIIRAELARRTGIDPSRFSRWLDGEGKPSFDQMRSIAEALRVSLDELAGLDTRKTELTEEEKRILDVARIAGYEVAMKRLMLLPETDQETPLISATPPPRPGEVRIEQRRGVG